MQVCPVDCFFDAGDMLVIHPEECIDCGACIDECPVAAIDTEESARGTEEEAFIEKNRAWFEERNTAAIEAARMAAG